MTIPTQSPWGIVDGSHEIATGIVEVSTPSHGGIKLAPRRQTEILRRFPAFRTFAGGSWYEEDCDACLVVIAFWEHFTPSALRGAVRLAHRSDVSGWTEVAAWLDSDDPQAVTIRETVARFEADHVDHWQRGSMGSTGPEWPFRPWWVSLTRVGDGARQQRIFAEYPTKSYYTDAELLELEASKLTTGA